MGSQANRRNRLPCIRLDRGEQNELIVTESFDPLAAHHDVWHPPGQPVRRLGPAAFRTPGQQAGSLLGRITSRIDAWLVSRLF